MAARTKQPEYARLLADCRGAYCEARLALVLPVTRGRIAALVHRPLPALTREGCAYLMQVRSTKCVRAGVQQPVHTMYARRALRRRAESIPALLRAS